MSDQGGEGPPRQGIRRGIYIVPSALTIGNIFCGFYAVINAAKGYQALSDPARAAALFENAGLAIGYAVLLDGLDGRIARMTKATSEFGVELDSIADVLTFGIAPAVLAYTWGYGSTPGLDRVGWGVSFFFLVCGALRLARFNVLARAPRFAATGTTPKLDKRFFVGLPIPPAAGLLGAIVHFSPSPLTAYAPGEARLYGWGLLLLIVMLALLMVSTLRYTSFKSVGPRSNRPFIVIPLLALLAAGIWFSSQWALLLLAVAYVAHGPALKLWGLVRRGRRPWAAEEEASRSAPAGS